MCSSDLALAAAPSAFAGYGPGAPYQVEISDNAPGGGVPGNGAWLWIELNTDGTGDYAGAICIHTGPAELDGAEPDSGDVTWSDTAGMAVLRSGDRQSPHHRPDELRFWTSPTWTDGSGAASLPLTVDANERVAARIFAAGG